MFIFCFVEEEGILELVVSAITGDDDEDTDKTKTEVKLLFSSEYSQQLFIRFLKKKKKTFIGKHRRR